MGSRKEEPEKGMETSCSEMSSYSSCLSDEKYIRGVGTLRQAVGQEKNREKMNTVNFFPLLTL